MAIDDQRGIVTPEAVVLEFETAGYATRTLARAIDLTLMLVAVSVLMFPVGLISVTDASWVAVILQVVVTFVVLYGYPVVFETLGGGRTPGKGALGLRVVTVDGAPVRFRHAAIRQVLFAAEVLLPFVPLLSMATTRDRQRLGDVFAGTIVLRERKGAPPVVAVRFPAPSGWEGYVATLDTAGLTSEQYGVVRGYLMRVTTLTGAARASLAAQLAAPVAARLHHTPPEGLDAEHFLVCVASAYQLRHGAPPLPWERIPGFGALADQPVASAASPTA